jgi:hypothetical protein
MQKALSKLPYNDVKNLNLYLLIFVFFGLLHFTPASPSR